MPDAIPIAVSPVRELPDGSASKVRLLFLVNDLRWFFTHRYPLAQAALSAGWLVHVAAPPSALAAELSGTGITFHPVPLHRGTVSLLAELKAMRALVRLYRAVRPTLVHHVTTKPVLYGAMAARLTGVPGVVNAVAGLGYIFMSDRWRVRPLRLAVTWMYRFVLGGRRSRLILQNPDDLAEFLGRRLVPPHSCVLIRGAGVDLQVFQPVPEPDGPVTFALIGRMLRDKGVADFVTAARMLQREDVSARFVLVGEPDAANPTSIPQATLERWVAEGVVEWWGHSHDVAAAMRRVHVIVLPSYREGLPKVLLEAAASGRPAVTNDVPGCREAVRDRVTGIIVPARDTAALAAAMRTLFEQAELRRRMGSAARALAEREFGVDKVVADTVRVYRSLLPFE
jgi:glycosyltransferase involved in cell wall biosynthesis